MTIDIQPIEIDARYYVEVSLDGTTMTPRGPFATADEAEAMAAQLGAISRAMHAEVRIGGTPAVRQRA